MTEPEHQLIEELARVTAEMTAWRQRARETEGLRIVAVSRLALMDRAYEEALRRIETANALLNSWLLSTPPLRGARPVEATRAHLANTVHAKKDPT